MRTAVIADYIAGKGCTRIARERGLVISTVKLWVKKSGIPRHRPTKPSMTPEIEAGAIALYQRGLSLEQVSREVGYTSSGVQKLLIRRGVERRQQREMTEDEILIATEMYKDRQSAKKIATKLGFEQGAVLRNLKKSGIVVTVGELNRKYSLDATAFTRPSPARSYWLGFTLADGCLTHRQRRHYPPTPVLTFGIGFLDRDHLHKLNEFLGSNGPIGTVKSKDGFTGKEHLSARVCYHSSVLCNSLVELGINPRKSGIETIPVGFEDDRDFWRGVVDGDGWVSIFLNAYDQPRQFVVGLCGSRSVCESFAGYIVRTIGGNRPKLTPNASIWSVQVACSRAHRLATHLYTDACCSLNRKATEVSRMNNLQKEWQISQAEKRVRYQRPCSVAGCNRRILSDKWGLCNKHYKAERRKSDPGYSR